MNTSKQIAKHFREVHFGGNWTVSSLKEHLTDITWEQSITKIHSFNTIATLVFHMNYFVDAIIHVLEGNPINAKDELSFAHPPINSQQDWLNIVNKTFTDAERFADLVEQLPEEKLGEIFVHEKYGIYYRNLHGVVEHCHYHLGQLVLVKKLVQEKSNQ